MSLRRSTSSTLRPTPQRKQDLSVHGSAALPRAHEGRGEKEQHPESKLAKYFETFTDRRQTEYAGADHDTERKEQNHLGDQPPRQEAGEERCYHGADGDPEQ